MKGEVVRISLCPFNSKTCIKDLCALYVEQEPRGECALSMLAKNTSDLLYLLTFASIELESQVEDESEA